MIYFCSQQNRRALVLQHPTLNGIDYLEVCDGGDPSCHCGKKLLLTLLKDARNLNLATAQILITGGASDAQVHATQILPATAATPRVVSIELDASGDFSTYTLALIANQSTADPPDGFDPQLSVVDFSFKAGCETVGDCIPVSCCPPPPAVQPDINYLAKEFDGFNQVMRDRLSVLVPAWQETHPSDIGVALVEVLAYAADRLSYQQDAVGTEAYLGTARSRISLRRHAKLVDYSLDEGQNARTWIFVEVTADSDVLQAGTRLYPRVSGLPVLIAPASRQAQQLNPALTFETLQDTTFFVKHNEMNFYTWSDNNCCLAPGATQATLADHFPNLTAGMIVLFEETMGPDTGDPDDADASRRWPVRLTRVQQTDYLNRPLVDPLDNSPITRIWWDPADALPFPLCISSTTDAAHGALSLKNVSVARANIVPADHGVSQDWEDLGIVPAAPAAPVTSVSCSCGSNNPPDSPRPRYFPRLANSPLTFASDFDPAAAASSFFQPTVPPKPRLQVRDNRLNPWAVLGDLLSSHELDKAVVAEIERDNTVFLRFGDGQNGMAADAGTSFQAMYRVGNGTSGNIGHDSLAHIVTTLKNIRSVRNPLPAQGGRDPETMEHIRQFAPFSFRTQLRAVTEDDYGVMAQRDPAIHEARGTLRWTGSWYTAFVSVDAAVRDQPTPALVTATENRLNLFRMTGVDLAVEGAVIVGLRIEMNICVAADHFQSDVRDAIMRVFIAGDLCNGQPGVLNPANFVFGQTIYTSPLIAAAQAVDGVSSVTLTVFQRMDDPTFDGTAQGFLTMHRLEIARCDNDPNRLDHGTFTLNMDGGK
jgi:hypothetical protein